MKVVALVLTMSLITYLIRVIPLAFFRKQIKSKYINSLLYYIPYAVLSAMTFPYIFYCTGSLLSAILGTVAALIASLTKRSLIIVAAIACSVVLITELILLLI